LCFMASFISIKHMSDLLNNKLKISENYDASQIEVLEGLEPVRKRPGMYVGGTDERAYHHLASEILDNSMDEAVAGHASWIDISVNADGSLTITDNGRGIPIDEHPKYKGKSALEVIMTTLHSGGKFSGKAYATSGGLHGVGISVVNALSDWVWIEVAREGQLYKQEYSRGKITTDLQSLGATSNRRGTKVCFHPDPEIFGDTLSFKPARLYKLARSKAYLYRGVEIRWHCDPVLIEEGSDILAEDKFSFPNGLADYLTSVIGNKKTVTDSICAGFLSFPNDEGRVEFAMTWPETGEGFVSSYCNTIPTPQGGTHESGLRSAILRSLKSYGEMVGEKKSSIITADDILARGAILLSVFIREPQFQGQTKEKLASAGATKLVDNAIKDHFDLWLSSDPNAGKALLYSVIEIAEERLSKRDDRIMSRKSATQRLRLPGKLADCSQTDADDTELFIVEGDSAGGSAKQARNSKTQAILPLRGKILNVVSATKDKIRANQEIQDLIQAMGTGSGNDFNLAKLRYERIIIMTDADVDGAHIASLLITFFYTQMKPLITAGHLYLAQPPLYRLSSGGVSAYAMTDIHREELLETTFKGKKKIDVSRFKGLGEMPAKQLKETTMDPSLRTLLRVTLPDATKVANVFSEDAGEEKIVDVDQLVEDLMGKNAEARFNFIQDNADRVEDLDI
jgi:topoisomerase-4 subunit B